MEASEWEGEARRMVRELGPLPDRIAAAMRRVPRHRFVPERYRAAAYADEPLPLPYGDATISAPHMVAIQLESAALAPGARVLEIGVGFGYLCALLADLVAPDGSVYGVDIEPRLVTEARRRLDATGYGARVALRAGDGCTGWPEAAPFDRILVSCATPELLPAWIDTLAVGGILVAPLGPAAGQELVRYRATPAGGHLEHGPRCRFVPLQRRLPSDI